MILKGSPDGLIPDSSSLGLQVLAEDLALLSPLPPLPLVSPLPRFPSLLPLLRSLSFSLLLFSLAPLSSLLVSLSLRVFSVWVTCSLFGEASWRKVARQHSVKVVALAGSFLG